MLNYVLYVLGMGTMNQSEIGLLGLFIGTFSLLAGLLLDAMVREGAFGVIFNTFLIAVGLFVALFIIGIRFGNISALSGPLVAGLAVCGAFVFVFLLALLKNAMLREH